MRKLVAGNWKMHHGPQGARSFAEAFEPPTGDDAPRVALFPPALSLAALRDSLPTRLDVRLGVQNIHPEPSGAFTGELSAEMAAEAGAALVLVGHSERRHVFRESDADTRQKVEAVYRASLTPVLCVGEQLDERRAGKLEAVLERQIEAVFAVESLRDRVIGGKELIVAYEPVWAIGTGETATPGDASAAHAFLRERLADRLGEAVASRIPILYGGSVKPANAAELMSSAEVDGVLVGGASLDADSFARIAHAAAG